MRKTLNIEWLTTGQAAAMHDMSTQLFLHYIKTGRGPDGEKRGRWWFFPKDEIELWEKPEPMKVGRKHYENTDEKK